MVDLNDLPAIAKDLVDKLYAAGFPPPGTSLATQQVLCVAEEAGEFVGAYRRWAGMARRTGPFSDVEDELADVIVTSFVSAAVLGIDLPEVIDRAMRRILNRPWRDPR